MALIYFGIAVAGYYTIHSLLAANRIKILLTRYVPPKYYRLGYNLLAVLLLIPVIALYFSIAKEMVFESSWLNTVIGWVMLLAGSIFIYFALRRYNLSEFSGTQYLRQDVMRPAITLVTSGLNAYVRHPLYFGTLLFIWGLFLRLPTTPLLVLAAITTAYIFIGAKLEEGKLIEEFGDEYLKYQKRVPMIIPGV